MHTSDFLLVNEAFFEDNSVCDAFHAIFDQVLERIAVWRHVKVAGSHLSDYEFDFKSACEDL